MSLSYIVQYFLKKKKESHTLLLSLKIYFITNYISKPIFLAETYECWAILQKTWWTTGSQCYFWLI